MASYDGATLKVTELFSEAHSTANVWLWRLHGCLLDFIHLSATGVTEIAKSTNLKVCPHTFVYIVYKTYQIRNADLGSGPPFPWNLIHYDLKV